MEKNMEQKRLTLSEYDAIVAFDRLCFPQDHWTEEDWRELLADERAVYLALLDDGRIVGDVFVYNWQGERATLATPIKGKSLPVQCFTEPSYKLSVKDQALVYGSMLTSG